MRALRVVVTAAALAVGGAVAATELDLETLSGRFALAVRAAESGQHRADIQYATLMYVLGDVRALIIGMGQSVAEFRRLVGDAYGLSHSHSEYFEILWQAGVLGLVLYGAFVYALFRRLRPSGRAPSGVLFAGRTMLVSGLVAGIAVGNIFITSARLAPFSLLMAFVYGAMVHESRNEAEWSSPC